MDVMDNLSLIAELREELARVKAELGTTQEHLDAWTEEAQKMVTDLRVQLQAAEAERDTWKSLYSPYRDKKLDADLTTTTALLQQARERSKSLELMIRDMDLLATKESDGEWVTGYRWNTGAWHKLLGVVNGAEPPAHILQQARILIAAIDAHEKAGRE